MGPDEWEAVLSGEAAAEYRRKRKSSPLGFPLEIRDELGRTMAQREKAHPEDIGEYERGLRAALEAVESDLAKDENGHKAGWVMAVEAIERLLEEVGRGRGDG